MTVQIELWALLTFLAGLLLAFFGAAFTAGRILLGQVQQRLDERFRTQERAREDGKAHWDERFGRVEHAVSSSVERTTDVERQLLMLKAELPLHYVRREDYVQGQSVIMARMDAIYSKLETLQQRGLQ